MTAAVQLQCVSELSAEIARLRDTIAFCEGQILRKQIAIAQIMDRDVPGGGGEEQVGGRIAPPSGEDETVASLLDRARLNYNGSTFRVCDLVKATAAMWPAEEPRIRRGAYSAVKRLVAAGRLQRLDLGRLKNQDKGEA